MLSRKIYGAWFLALGLATLSISSRAQTLLPLDLDLPTAIRLANEHNPILNEARERIREQDGVLTVSKSSRLPDLNAFGTYQWEEDSRSGSFGAPNPPDKEHWRAGVEVTQPLYAGGMLSAAVRSRTYQGLALEARRDATQSQVLTDVYRKFFGALLARETIRVQEESLSLAERQLGLAKNRFDAGAVSRFDVMQSEVRVANSRPPLIRANNNYVVAIDDLRTSLGVVYPDHAGPTNINLVGTWESSKLTNDLPTCISQAMENRFELIAARMQIEAARSWVQRMKRQRAPRVNFFANYSVENDRFSAESTNLEGWQAGVEASLNIWEGGRIRGEVAQAQSQLDQAVLQEQAVRLAIELDVRSAWNQAMEAEEILDASKLVISQAEEALRLAENRYNAGVLTQLDVLSTQLDFTRAKLDNITAAHDYHLALVELLKATGGKPGEQFIAE